MSFAELIPIVQTLPQHDKLQLIKILQDDVSVIEDIFSRSNAPALECLL